MGWEQAMSKPKRILCPVDFSEFSVRAYRYALSLACHYQAQLFVQHIVELWRHPCINFAPSVQLLDDSCRRILVHGEEQLQEFVKSHTRCDIRPECVVQQGGIASDFILSFALKRETDMIVMGTHGRRGFDRLMLGSVTERVVREAPCPVLAVCSPSRDLITSEKGQDHVRLARILFCTDFSEDSQRALDYAISLTVEYNAELTLLHVAQDKTGWVGYEGSTSRAAKQLAKLIPLEACKNCRIKTTVRTGTAYREIIQLASEMEADLVVMAVRGRNALDLAVFGSTTYRVIQLGTCPVLAVHVGRVAP
jgi:nucleotide-binding universal stress UspA family protein